MKNNIQGKGYEIVIASDVSSRDGIGAELWYQGDMLVEIFRDDTLRKMSFFVSKQIDIPLEVIDELLRAFEEISGRKFIDYEAAEDTGQ
jgi:hypothetical protein